MFPKLNLSQWDKAWRDLCSGQCSLLSLELFSKTSTPSINEYYYKPKESPAFNNLLYKEDALKKLTLTFPEPMIQPYYECSASPSEAAQTSIGVASSSATLYGTIGLTILCFLIFIHIIGKKNGPKLRTILHKEELDAFGKDVMNRKVLHSLNLIAKELAAMNRDTEGIEMLFQNIKALDFASKGLIEVEEADDDDGKKHTRGLLKELIAFAVESGKG